MASHIARALLVETGTYNDLTYRPYQTNYSMSSLMEFQEVTQGGRFITPDAIAGVSGKFLKPSGEPEKDSMGRPMIVGVDNGWGQSRFRFLLEVVTRNHWGGTRQFVSGYTDHPGANMSGDINPQMRLYINNVVTMRDVEEVTPTGRSVRSTVADASHILNGEYSPGFGHTGNTPLTMRPEDVFSKMSTLDMTDVTDCRLNFAGGVKKSRRSNGSAPNYVSKVLESYRQAHEDDSQSPADMFGMLDNARGKVVEPTLSGDSFLFTLKRETSFVEGTSVAWGELVGLHPELNRDDITIVQFATGQAGQQLHHQGQTEHFNGTTLETVACVALAHSVPSLMMDLMLLKIQFGATNRTLNGQYDVYVTGANSFTQGVDLTPYFNSFINRLKSEVLQGLSENNLIDFEFTMVADILGETRISISMNGGPVIDYAFPSFCDALFTPVVTHHDETINQLAFEIQNLASSIGVTHAEHAPMGAGPQNQFAVGGYNSGSQSAL